MRFTAGLSALCLYLALSTLVNCNFVAARATPPPSPQQSTKYIFAVIGDSLSDTGNSLAAAGVPDPNYYWRGRFTNGPSWTEYFRASINAKHDVQFFNYAFGGATACQMPAMEAARPWIKNMTGQSVAFAADVASGKIPTGKNVRLVPVQWIGSNDVLFPLTIAKVTGVMPDMVAVAGAIIKCRVAGAAFLAAIPGVKDIVIVPMSPMHTSPAVPASFKPQIKALGDAISAGMAAAVAGLQAKLDAANLGVKVHLLGSPDWIEEGMATIRPNYKQLDAPCFVTPSALDQVSKNFTGFCDNPTEHLFYDAAHPETRFHAWFATVGLIPRMRQLRLVP